MINDYTNYVSGNDFINKNADVKTTESDFDYNSFYRAYVVSIDDPEKLGRVKIQIPSLHTNSGFYPWAYPACFVGLGYQTGSFILPPVGSIVFVTFEYSDEHRPIYFGGIPTRYAPGKEQSYGNFINSGAPTMVLGDDIPSEYTGTQQIVYKAPNGNIIYMDSSDSYNAIILRSMFQQQFAIVNEVTDEGDMVSYLEMRFSDDDYFRIKAGSFEWISNGEPVDIGGGGGSGTAKTVIW